jgi:class 3 adenylate cyclase
MKSTFVILVMIDIVDSTKFIERVGDMRASEVMRVYDRIFRGLLIKYEGLEIDKTDGALLLFETMKDALNYVTAYHDMVERHLGLRSRCGIHCGNIMMHSNNQVFVSRGAKPIEVEGLQKAVTARIMSLAGGGQTLLSKRAGEYAASIRGKLLMRDMGVWQLKGVKHPMQLYAISNDVNRLARPKENDKVKMVRPPKLTPKERRNRFIRRYIFYPVILFTGYFWLCFIAMLEYLGYFKYAVATTILHYGKYLILPFYRDFWTWLFSVFFP